MAAAAMLAAAAVIASTPVDASQAAQVTAHVADTGGSGGVGPDTPLPPPPPPPPGVKPMDTRTSWVFPIREVGGVLSPSQWSEDQGVDLGGMSSFCGSRATLLAVDDGVVAGIGISGFGSQSPIIKLTHGLYKGRYVYYGHSAPVLVRKGQKVKRGQAIARIGCGIVGYSSAPHLEIGLYSKGQAYCCPGWGQTSGIVMSTLKRMWPTALARHRQSRR